jgi:hypothetical protein
MNKPKHIALWACPRSCSTVVARSFEQRNDCMVFDEPFYPPYLLTHGFDHPMRETIVQVYETDYRKVIKTLESPLPPPTRFGFQKQLSKNILPDYGTEWFPMHNIFLLREPWKVVVSYQKVRSIKIMSEDIGMESLYRIFKHVMAANPSSALVIHSNDLLANPRLVLQKICVAFGIPFSESMMNWKSNFTDSSLFFTERNQLDSDLWYGTLKNSTGFIKPKAEDTCRIPEELLPVIESCMPFYQEMLAHSINF